MGRKKIQIQPIKDDRNRQVTFLKRKHGLMKKAYELSVLCNCEVALVIIPSNNKIIQYSSSDMDLLLTRFKKSDCPREIKTNEDFMENTAKDGHHGDDESDNDTLEQSEKVVNEIKPQQQQQQHQEKHQQPVMVVPTQPDMSFPFNTTRPYGYTNVRHPLLLQNNVLPASFDLYHQQQQQQQQQQLFLLHQNIQQQQEHRQMMTQQFHPATLMMHEAGTLYNNNNSHQNKTPPPALYHSPPHLSPDQSPKSEPGTPDKRPKLNVTIPQDMTKQAIEPGSALPSQFAQNLPSPTTFFPEFYSLSPIQTASPFLIPTTSTPLFRETGVRNMTDKRPHYSQEEDKKSKKTRTEA